MKGRFPALSLDVDVSASPLPSSVLARSGGVQHISRTSNPPHSARPLGNPEFLSITSLQPQKRSSDQLSLPNTGGRRRFSLGLSGLMGVPLRDLKTYASSENVIAEWKLLEKAKQRVDKEMYASALLPANAHRNRYANVLPVESTRVRLCNHHRSTEHDYINANYVDDECGNPRAYIVAQGPLDCTVADFWHMVFEHRCPVIVMLANEFEQSKRKCHRYWPSDNEVIEAEGLRVQCSGEENCGEFVKRAIIVTSREGAQLGVTMIHYTTWPDFDVPQTSGGMRRVLHEVDKISNGSAQPIVVHCSAGIGRSGTFCAIHITMRKLRKQTQRSLQLQLAALNASGGPSTAAPVLSSSPYSSGAVPPTPGKGPAAGVAGGWGAPLQPIAEVSANSVASSFPPPPAATHSWPAMDSGAAASSSGAALQFNTRSPSLGPVPSSARSTTSATSATSNASNNSSRSSVAGTASPEPDEITINIYRTVSLMRSQRPGMVQTDVQYQFIYRCLVDEIGSMLV